ncbi:hypothetical protein Q4I32_000605, partial [Leishmania shawi]
MSGVTSPLVVKRRTNALRGSATWDMTMVPPLATEGSGESYASVGQGPLSNISPIADNISSPHLSDSHSHDFSACGISTSSPTSRLRHSCLSLKLPLGKLLGSGACRVVHRFVSALALLLLLYVLTATQFLENASLTRVENALDHLVNLQDPERGPWSVLVQHEDALQRLNFTHQQRCRVGSMLCDPLVVGAAFLPSWTLHVVEKGCADCTDQQTYASAVEGVVLQARHAVFATSAAPLGRVGPMLLAMASVTDDVDVRAELPQWEWLRHVHGSGFPAVGGGA